MTDIMTKILEAGDHFYEATGKNMDYFDVNIKEYTELSLLLNKNYTRSMPSPPVKKTVSSAGLFFRSTEIEYDHHAPEYLQEMARYRDDVYRMSRQCDSSALALYTPHGMTKIRIIKND